MKNIQAYKIAELHRRVRGAALRLWWQTSSASFQFLKLSNRNVNLAWDSDWKNSPSQPASHPGISLNIIQSHTHKQLPYRL